MSDRSLCVALIAGPMYDPLYRKLEDFRQATGIAVHIDYRGSLPESNAHLTSLDKVPYDLVSTHTKYAPSQLSFLAALDHLPGWLEVDTFYPRLVDLATMDGRLYGVPHNVDAKLLHYRIEIDDTARRDWNELVATARRLSDGALLYGFVLPAMDSGLFGMFYELAEMVGASLFPAANIPRLNNEGGRWAPTIIRDLRCLRAVPAEIVNWYFDKVHRCFLEGSAAMVCDWPGYYGTYRYSPDFKVRETFQVARMPGGPVDGNKAYGGSHTFALTRRGAASPSAVALLRFLTSPEEQLLEARQGSVPPRPPILAQVQSEAEPPRAARWRLLDSVKSNDILIPSRLPYYPEIEETLWQTVRSAMM